MRLLIASDHAGFELKKTLVVFLREQGHEVEDLGPHEYAATDDYPDYIAPLARQIAAAHEARGIVIGGSGQGEAMVANRTVGVRAAVCYGGADAEHIVRLSREHNDANVLSLGARFLSDDEAKALVSLWLATPFSGDERHVRRIGKIDNA